MRVRGARPQSLAWPGTNLFFSLFLQGPTVWRLFPKSNPSQKCKVSPAGRGKVSWIVCMSFVKHGLHMLLWTRVQSSEFKLVKTTSRPGKLSRSRSQRTADHTATTRPLHNISRMPHPNCPNPVRHIDYVWTWPSGCGVHQSGGQAIPSAGAVGFRRAGSA